MYYKENLGLETKFKEYKEFNFFNSGIKISNDDAIRLLKTNKWIFNKLVNTCINNMLEIYLPKYACAYLSEPIEKQGELYFGIDDTGLVTGIPYQGELNKTKIINKIKYIFKKNIKFDNDIFNYLTIDIIKLNIDNIKTVPDFNQILLKYYKHLKIYNLKKEKYLSNKKTWYNLLNRYNAKLSDLVNNHDTRYELIEYIRYIHPFNPVIKLLKGDFKLTNVTTYDIINNKRDIDNIYYWLTEWKDKMLQFVKSIRPYFYYKIPSEYYPMNILILVKNMIPYWIKYNDNMNLFLIKFTFNNTSYNNIKYKNIFNEWISCKRVIFNGEPCCIKN